MIRRLSRLALLAALLLPLSPVSAADGASGGAAEQAEGDPGSASSGSGQGSGDTGLDAEGLVALFRDACLSGFPDLSAGEKALQEKGFEGPGPAGFFSHPDRPVEVVLNDNEGLEGVGSACLISAVGPDFETARKGVEQLLDGLAQNFVSAPLEEVEQKTGQPVWMAVTEGRQVIVGADREKNVTFVTIAETFKVQPSDGTSG